MPVAAQVSLYTFSQSTQPYTEISAADGGYVLGTPTFFPPLHNIIAYANPDNPDGSYGATYLNPAVGPGYPIGFSFLYNGESFDRIGVSNGGWISFGRSSDGNQAVSVFCSDHSGGRPLSHSYYATPIAPHKRNRIAGMGTANLRQQDQSTLGGVTSEFRVATVGTAPNRVCVVQWKNFRYSYSNYNDVANFQIRLNEADNSVDVRFGDMVWPSGVGAYCQIGLGGRNNTDYNNRETVPDEPTFLYDWNTTVQGADSGSSCVMSYDSPFNEPYTATPPVPGLNFHWAAPSCAVPAWPLTLSEVTYESALVEWTSVAPSMTYDYVVATINDPNDPNAITTGSTQALSVFVSGLQPLTYYYAFVRSNCGGQPGVWSLATRFRSQGGGVLECGGLPVTEEYCYATGDRIVWTYTTSDGASPVRLNMLAGSIVGPNVLRIYYGPDTLGTPVWTTNSGGAIPGQVFTSTSSELTVYLKAPENGSCQVHEFVEPFEWTVGCFDCTPALAAYSLTGLDCDELAYDITVNVVSMGSATQLVISNSQGLAPTEISATGVYTVGPFQAGTPVVVTMENPVNELCNTSSVPFVNDPCPVVDCGPTDYTYCYGANDASQWLYQGDGQPIGIRFRQGNLSFGDQLSIFDGDPDVVAPTQYDGNLANVLETSSTAANDLLLSLSTSATWDCQDGNALPWDYVVACYDGCVQPRATFAVLEDCANAQFRVDVSITDIGSTGSVTITNTGGAPVVNANAVGVYTVGPFASQEVVNIEVVGASVLCSWTSRSLTFDCVVGVEEEHRGRLSVVPNPSNGQLRVQLPDAFSGLAQMQVLDLQGRLVSEGRVEMKGPSVDLSFEQLPTGSYFLTLSNGTQRYTGKIQIIH